MIEKVHISWEEIRRVSIVPVQKIRLLTPVVHNVWGVAKGGIVPALLCAELGGFEIIMDSKCKCNKHTCIIDDICDTGKTMALYRGSSRDVLAGATLYCRPESTKYVNCYGEIWTGGFIVFPWEPEWGQ